MGSSPFVKTDAGTLIVKTRTKIRSAISILKESDRKTTVINNI